MLPRADLPTRVDEAHSFWRDKYGFVGGSFGRSFTSALSLGDEGGSAAVLPNNRGGQVVRGPGRIELPSRALKPLKRRGFAPPT